MGSSSKTPPVEQTALAAKEEAKTTATAQEQTQTQVQAADPDPTDISSDISEQQAKDVRKNRKGRSWSLLSRAGSDSRRTVLNGGNNTLGG